jgi:hypothetical protein
MDFRWKSVGQAFATAKQAFEMFIDSEVLTGPSGMAVYKDRIRKWDSPYDNVPVTDSDRGFSTTFVKPFARKASRSMSYELTRNSRVSDDLAVLQSGNWLPILLAFA